MRSGSLLHSGLFSFSEESVYDPDQQAWESMSTCTFVITDIMMGIVFQSVHSNQTPGCSTTKGTTSLHSSPLDIYCGLQ